MLHMLMIEINNNRRENRLLCHGTERWCDKKIDGQAKIPLMEVFLVKHANNNDIESERRIC